TPPKGGVPPPPKWGVHWPRLLTIPQLPRVLDALQIPLQPNWTHLPAVPDWKSDWWLLYVQDHSLTPEQRQLLLETRDPSLMPFLQASIHLLISDQLTQVDFLTESDQLRLYKQYVHERYARHDCQELKIGTRPICYER